MTRRFKILLNIRHRNVINKKSISRRIIQIFLLDFAKMVWVRKDTNYVHFLIFFFNFSFVKPNIAFCTTFSYRQSHFQRALFTLQFCWNKFCSNSIKASQFAGSFVLLINSSKLIGLFILCKKFFFDFFKKTMFLKKSFIFRFFCVETEKRNRSLRKKFKAKNS